MGIFLKSLRTPVTACLLAATLLAGCIDEAWRGEVARINGTSIMLGQVEALRNSTHFEWTSTPMAEMEQMRQQYGEALTNLLAVELVKQYLKRKELSVTDAEVAAEENLIRSDYPPGTFEDFLVKDAIDLEHWRFLLRNYLSVQRFLDKVIKPGITISSQEVAAYIKAHPEEFVRPPWVHFFLVSGPDKALVEKCAGELARNTTAVAAQAANPGVVIRDVRLDAPRLEASMDAALAKIAPGELSAVLQLDGEFHQMLLQERLPEHQLDPGDVYLEIEKSLFNQKISVSYNNWIGSRMAKADIQVATRLLPKEERPAAPAKPQGATPSSGKNAEEKPVSAARLPRAGS